MTRVKICCIGSEQEAEMAIEQGASALGLVSEMPSGPGVISEARIAEIAATVPPGATSVLLTSRSDAESISAQQRLTGVNAIQICDYMPYEELRRLGADLPGIALIQVIHVSGPASLEEAVAVAPYVNALLLDSGNPHLAVKELGGTGRQHDWTISRRIRDAVRRPIFLAGGITPDNVGRAITQVQPYGLDLCTGVRTDGLLDAVKLRRLFEAVRRAHG